MAPEPHDKVPPGVVAALAVWVLCAIPIWAAGDVVANSELLTWFAGLPRNVQGFGPMLPILGAQAIGEKLAGTRGAIVGALAVGLPLALFLWKELLA